LSSDCEKTQPRLRKRRSGTPGNISADELERPVATNETVLLEIAELRRRAERAEAGWREEENKRRRAEESRKQAETRAEEYRRESALLHLLSYGGGLIWDFRSSGDVQTGDTAESTFAATPASKIGELAVGEA